MLNLATRRKNLSLEPTTPTTPTYATLTARRRLSRRGGYVYFWVGVEVGLMLGGLRVLVFSDLGCGAIRICCKSLSAGSFVERVRSPILRD